MTRDLRWSAVLLAAALVTAAAANPLCHALHLCGCAPVWSGGEASCNVHDVSGPRCPWCEHRWLGASAFGAILAGQWLAIRATRRRGWRPVAAAAVAAATLAVGGPAVGLLTWLPTDYPHFLVKDARSRLGLPEGPVRCVAPHGPATQARCHGGGLL